MKDFNEMTKDEIQDCIGETLRQMYFEIEDKKIKSLREIQAWIGLVENWVIGTKVVGNLRIEK